MRRCIEPASKLRSIAICTSRIRPLSIPRRRCLESVRVGTVAKLSSHRHCISTMSTKPDASSEETEALPKLSASEFREYNRLAEHMDYFVCLVFSLNINSN